MRSARPAAPALGRVFRHGVARLATLPNEHPVKHEVPHGSMRFAMARSHLMQGLASPICDIEVERAEGSWVYTTDGHDLLDFTCGIGVTNLGHCHPKVVAAAQYQLTQLCHGAVAVGLSKPLIALTEKLVNGIIPPAHDRVMYATTGAEAVENAVRLARAATGKPNIISFQGGYHGRTSATLALTRSKTAYGTRNFPQMSGVFCAPFPYLVQSSGLGVEDCLFQLDLLLKQQTAPEDTAAIIIEPVLGEGGYVEAPHAFLHGLRERCDKHNIKLILDEVQTGFGRTGKMFAHQHSGVQPDILVMAKGIANGIPIAAISSRSDLTAHSPPGTMGGTYAGNPVACAAALATLDVFTSEPILENVVARGKQLTDLLEGVKARHPDIIKEVRGVGLMVGLEMTADMPAYSARDLSLRCASEGLLILTAGTFETMRFIPPLTVSEGDLAEGVKRFEAAIDSLWGQHAERVSKEEAMLRSKGGSSVAD